MTALVMRRAGAPHNAKADAVCGNCAAGRHRSCFSLACLCGRCNQARAWQRAEGLRSCAATASGPYREPHPCEKRNGLRRVGRAWLCLVHARMAGERRGRAQTI